MSLSCSGIRKTYGAFVALDGVSLGVEPGEVLGIAGPNGAGKTTLFDVLSGRVRPEAGRVVLAGRDITALPPHARARLGLGRTFQAPLVPTALTVAETLAAVRRAWGRTVEQAVVDHACELVRLGACGSIVAGSLDTLGRRKLLLASLLMRRPSVLLLDEPASGLLTAEIEEMDAIIRAIVAETGAALIVVEHRLELLFSVSARVVVMDAGRSIAEGPPAEVFADPRVREAYFEAPGATWAPTAGVRA